MLKKFIIIIILSASGCTPQNVKVSYDQHVFDAAVQVIRDIKGRPTVSNFSYTVFTEEGVIETAWFNTHKGEVRLKVTCLVRGKDWSFRVKHKGILFDSENREPAVIFRKSLESSMKKNLE